VVRDVDGSAGTDPVSTDVPGPVAQLRTAALGTCGAVTSSHPSVSAVGAWTLAAGGNAVDATIAMAAAAWLALPGQCGVGGDAFALVREPDGRVWTVNGSGFGPDGGTSQFYWSRDLDAIPLTGALSVAVPGAMAAVQTLHRRATRSLAELWEPAIHAGETGVPCTAKTRADIAEHADTLAADPDARAIFLSGGAPPPIGQLIRQLDLAATLRLLAEDPTAFYTGWLADRTLAALTSAGAPFSGQEWALGRKAPVEPAITGAYGGLRLHQTPLPSAGWMVLHQAALLDGQLADVDQLGAQAIHWFAEAARASFRHRFEHCGSDNDHWRTALSAASVCRTRRDIRRRQSEAAPGMAVPGDTTSTVCVDADGTAVSFIHSLAFTFGARMMVPGTGVLLNNRLGRGAYLIGGHPNEIRPRRKPLHTLNAWLLDEPGGLRAVGNCPGGDGQVQWNMQVISHLVDHGDDPQRAVSLPRVTALPGSDADTLGRPAVLRCEQGISRRTLVELERWGHTVERVPVQRGGPGGSALTVTREQQYGVLHAAADPRMEGVALAL
jgi:gamma-glutamyltranspeptidase / glutathione hydrolase